MSTTQAPDPGPFLIDGPEHSDRDREMFCLGVEYRAMKELIEGLSSFAVPIHAENLERVRAIANQAGKAPWWERGGDPRWVFFGIGDRK